MALKITTGSEDYEIIDEGVWDSDLIHMEERREMNHFDNTEGDKIRMEFLLLEGPNVGRRAMISVNPNISSKSKLFAICKAVMRREFQVDELAFISTGGIAALESFLGGMPIRVIIKHKVSAKGRLYYYISDYMASPRQSGQSGYIDHTKRMENNNEPESGSNPVADKPFITQVPTMPERPAPTNMVEESKEFTASIDAAVRPKTDEELINEAMEKSGLGKADAVPKAAPKSF